MNSIASLGKWVRAASLPTVALFILGFFVSVVVWWSGMVVPSPFVGTLFSAKLGMISLLVGALAFYLRLIWDDLQRFEGDKTAQGIAIAIRYHRRSFTLLYGTTIILLISVITDLFSILFSSPSLAAASLGYFSTGLALTFTFLIYFYGRSLSELETLRQAVSVQELAAQSPPGSPPAKR